MTDLATSAVAQALRETTPATPPGATEQAHRVVDTTATLFSLPVEQVYGPSRARLVVGARFVAWTVIRATTTLSFPAIGAMFNRDHTTICSGVARAMQDDELRSYAAAVMAALDGEAT